MAVVYLGLCSFAVLSFAERRFGFGDEVKLRESEGMVWLDNHKQKQQQQQQQHSGLSQEGLGIAY